MHNFTQEQLDEAMDRAVDRCIHIDDALARTAAIRRAMLEEGIALASAGKAYDCLVPWLDGRPLVNAVGTSEAECQANLAMLDLDDDDLKRVALKNGSIHVSLDNQHATTASDSK